MDFWSGNVGKDQRLTKLPLAALTSVAVACVDHAAASVLPAVRNGVSEAAMKIAWEAIELMWGAVAGNSPPASHEFLERLSEIIPGDGNGAAPDPPGWQGIVLSLYELLEANLDRTKSRDVCLRAIEEAFLSIAYRVAAERKATQKPRPYVGIEECARASDLCRLEAAFQNRMLDLADANSPLPRTTKARR